jgi:hypothetical protein
MNHVSLLLTLLIFPLLMTACAGEESDAPGTTQGPALIMFYTDN